MAAVTTTNSPTRHDTGDLIVRFYDMSGGDGDTYTVGQGVNIRDVLVTPTTNISLGASVSGQVITFHSSGAWAAKVGIWSRTG